MIDLEGVVPALNEALVKRGYDVLTPVQAEVLDPGLDEADLLVSAQTGSGKTVAFGLALAPALLQGAERFTRASVPLALIVTPTRELALQVKRELQWLYEMTGASFASCVGGMDMRDERRDLSRGAHIVVGTPGRLRDHIERGTFDTTGLKAVVLDEADEMLDLGFRDDLEYILQSAPENRRTLMFSATVPRTIASLAKRYQRDAVRISTQAEQKQHLDIEYRALTIAPNDRENAIINVLRYFEAKNALVFCSTRATVNHMTSRFANRGFSVVALSGELNQNARSHALQAMRDGRARVCIATDVAARGIDLPNLELVIHADIPKSRETLLHRSGRTGRAGRKGVSVVIVPHNARKRTERLLSSAKIQATWASPPSADDVLKRDRDRVLAHPALSEPLSEEERAFAQDLMSLHNPEQIAAAYLRQHLADLSAPEELLNAAPIEREKRKYDDFVGGGWISLSVGREEGAEPRWLLPMLCRAGNITRREIGAIKINFKETIVELADGYLEKFMKAVGPDGVVDKDITVTRLDHVPDMSRDSGHSSKPKPHRGKRPPYEKKFEKKFDKKPEKRFEDKREERSEERYKPRTKPAEKRASSHKPAQSSSQKSEQYSDNKPYSGKKPHSDKKSFSEKKPFSDKKPLRKLTQKSDQNSAPKSAPKAQRPAEGRDNNDVFDKPRGKTFTKKPGKPKTSRAARKDARGDAPKGAKSEGRNFRGGPKPGSGPLKRKKAPK